MKKIIIAVILIVAISNLFAYSMMNRETGNFVYNLDARTSAMGQAMAIGGKHLFDLGINPANFNYLENGIGFQTAFGLINDKEDRSVPMYNSFDAYAGNAVYASNENYFASTGFGVFYKNNINELNFVTAFSLRPYIDFNAKYEEEVRNNENTDNDNYPPIIANNTIEGDGVINSYDFTLGASYADKYSFGIMLSKLKGDDTINRDLIWSKQAKDMMQSTADSLVDEHFEMKRDFDGFTFNVGLGYKVSKRLEVGFSFVPKTEITVTGKVNNISFTAKDSLGNPLAIWGYEYLTELDSLGSEIIVDTTAISYDKKYNPYILPSRIRFGFMFKPRNIMRTEFHIDMEYVTWSDVNPLYDNAFNYYIGVEHKSRFYMPFRFGFSYSTDYKMNYDESKRWVSKITMPTFTIGSGFKYGQHLSFDFSAQFSHRTYEALDLFPDSVYDHQELWNNYNYLNLQDRGWDNPDTVNENLIGLKASVSFVW